MDMGFPFSGFGDDSKEKNYPYMAPDMSAMLETIQTLRSQNQMLQDGMAMREEQQDKKWMRAMLVQLLSMPILMAGSYFGAKYVSESHFEGKMKLQQLEQKILDLNLQGINSSPDYYSYERVAQLAAHFGITELDTEEKIKVFSLQEGAAGAEALRSLINLDRETLGADERSLKFMRERAQELRQEVNRLLKE